MENTLDVEITIDPATGLPALEEGLFWRVEERPHYVHPRHTAGARFDNGEIYVSIMRTIPDTMKTVTDTETVKGTWRNLWRPTYKHTEREVVQFEGRPREVACGVMADYETIHYLDETPEGFTRTMVRDLGDRTQQCVRLWDPTPENVAKKAAEVYTEYMAKRMLWEEAERMKKEAQDKVDRIVGDYPPKKLEVGE